MAGNLQRRIGLPLLTAYGVGVIVGAGIYVLIGGVAGAAGIWAPVAFVLAGLVAAPSALSYAELSTRIPEAAGEAAYVEKGLNSHALSLLVGFGIVLAGLISAAAVLRGGVGYLMAVVDLPFAPLILGIGALLVALAAWGVLESLAFAAVLTAIEVLGLALVCWAGWVAVPSGDWMAAAPPAWAGIGVGASLAFFAFIGFEDIVNMAEEAVTPEKTLPRAILLSLVITTLIYTAVAIAAVRTVPLADLAASEQPLALVWSYGTGGNPAFLSLIAVAAALNGVLAQIVMASRVLFGLGRRSPRLAVFHVAHPTRHTPMRATLLVGAGVIAAALTLPVVQLAGMTTVVLLSVFAVVNLSLIGMKRQSAEAPFRVPGAVPWVGLVATLLALVLAVGGLG